MINQYVRNILSRFSILTMAVKEKRKNEQMFR